MPRTQLAGVAKPVLASDILIVFLTRFTTKRATRHVRGKAADVSFLYICVQVPKYLVKSSKNNRCKFSRCTGLHNAARAVSSSYRRMTVASTYLLGGIEERHGITLPWRTWLREGYLRGIGKYRSSWGRFCIKSSCPGIWAVARWASFSL